MYDSSTMIALACFGLVGLTLVVAAALKGWQGWLELKRLELTGLQSAGRPVGPGERIEMADLKERIRKLESLAACIDL
jgi:hypothetical protein